MDKARDREVRKLVKEQERLQAQRAAPAVSTPYGGTPWAGTSTCDELDVIGCIGRAVWNIFSDG